MHNFLKVKVDNGKSGIVQYGNFKFRSKIFPVCFNIAVSLLSPSRRPVLFELNQKILSVHLVPDHHMSCFHLRIRMFDCRTHTYIYTNTNTNTHAKTPPCRPSEPAPPSPSSWLIERPPPANRVTRQMFHNKGYVGLKRTRETWPASTTSPGSTFTTTTSAFIGAPTWGVGQCPQDYFILICLYIVHYCRTGYGIGADFLK